MVIFRINDTFTVADGSAFVAIKTFIHCRCEVEHF